MLRFFRRQRPVQETDYQELRENFELCEPISHGVPRNVYRLAVDSSLGLVAVITKQGYLELYTESGQKRVLLKKLGSPSSFFDFIEGEKLLLIVCVANPSNGLPEAYHLIDTTGSEPCSTTCRPSTSPQARCFTISKLPNHNGKCLLTGNSNGSLYVSELKRNCDQLDFTELVSIPSLLPNLPSTKFSDFTHVRTSRRFIFCCFQNSFIVVLCAETKKLLKTVDLPSKFTAITINESLQCALFVSTELYSCISLENLAIFSSKLTANSFERTSFYQVVVSARTNQPLVLFSSGIPECTIRRSSSLTLATQDGIRVFALASELLDVRVVYENTSETDKRKATTVILLCEQEIIAIDLMDAEYRCMSLNFLQCVDSSSITTIQVQTVSNAEFSQPSADNQFSKRTQLFEKATLKQIDDDPRNLIFTGHQSGDIFVWDFTNGDQRLLQVFRTTNYLRICEDECPDESLEEVDIEEDAHFSVEQSDHHEFSINEVPNLFDWLRQPANIWKHSKTKRIQEIGFYDDRWYVNSRKDTLRKILPDMTDLSRGFLMNKLY